jgi:hypothetical protein
LGFKKEIEYLGKKPKAKPKRAYIDQVQMP